MHPLSHRLLRLPPGVRLPMRHAPCTMRFALPRSCPHQTSPVPSSPSSRTAVPPSRPPPNYLHLAPVPLPLRIHPLDEPSFPSSLILSTLTSSSHRLRDQRRGPSRRSFLPFPPQQLHSSLRRTYTTVDNSPVLLAHSSSDSDLTFPSRWRSFGAAAAAAPCSSRGAFPTLVRPGFLPPLPFPFFSLSPFLDLSPGQPYCLALDLGAEQASTSVIDIDTDTDIDIGHPSIFQSLWVCRKSSISTRITIVASILQCHPPPCDAKPLRSAALASFDRQRARQCTHENQNQTCTLRERGQR